MAVTEIQIFNTVMLTPENKTVIIPIGALGNGAIVNYSRHGNLRVDIVAAVEPGSDISIIRHWDVFFGVQEQIKITFEQNNIQGPVPHQVVIHENA